MHFPTATALGDGLNIQVGTRQELAWHDCVGCAEAMASASDNADGKPATPKAPPNPRWA